MSMRSSTSRLPTCRRRKRKLEAKMLEEQLALEMERDTDGEEDEDGESELDGTCK